MRTSATSRSRSSRRASSRSKYTLPLQNTTRRTCAAAQLVDLVDHAREAAVRELLERRDRQLVAQQALRRHDDQRLAEGLAHLPAQHVEHLRRRRGHAHLHVVLGAQLQEALEARRGVLRALRPRSRAAAAASRPQKRSHLASPELMNWSMMTWAPLAKSPNWRFPDHERLRVGGRVAVLEAQHRLLRQHRVDDLHARLRLARGAAAGSRWHRSFWSCSTAWRWKNVPRPLSWPVRRTP